MLQCVSVIQEFKDQACVRYYVPKLKTVFNTSYYEYQASTKKKVKVFRYKPEVALGVPEGKAPGSSRLSAL
jgi:hypothetical protein